MIEMERMSRRALRRAIAERWSYTRLFTDGSATGIHARVTTYANGCADIQELVRTTNGGMARVVDDGERSWCELAAT